MRAAVSGVSLIPTYARRQIVAEDRVGVYHCIARCVRRAFLCGIDLYSGQGIELAGNGARIRSADQSGGRAIKFARRCRGALLAALVSGQGGGPNGLSVGQRLDAEP